VIQELGERQMAVEIECRTADLRAADDLLAKMSPAGRTAMMAWIEETRRASTEHVYPERMPWFHLPAWTGVRK
jgi:hypothetical protein